MLTVPGLDCAGYLAGKGTAFQLTCNFAPNARDHSVKSRLGTIVHLLKLTLIRYRNEQGRNITKMYYKIYINSRFTFSKYWKSIKLFHVESRTERDVFQHMTWPKITVCTLESLKWFLLHVYRPQTKLRKGNTFTSVCQTRQTSPQQTATAADGTHPTGIHSCFVLHSNDIH